MPAGVQVAAADLAWLELIPAVLDGDVLDTATLIAGSALATGILLDIPTLCYRRHDAQRSRHPGLL
ncbi:hypothetical protein [Frankia gtarii]|uniref:hypothetical protein n=1 Tax=Frankia gtarii TaxID=2950102 RepID=UPI0021BE2322|nr:hypothetical protein [Frankia gtarii]